jgi:hypothetical protein
MPTSNTKPPRRKSSPQSSDGPPRRQHSSSRTAPTHPHVAAWRFRPIAVAAAGVFLAAYVLDWRAVLGLMWACFAGQLGRPVCIASFGVLVLLAFTVAWALRRPAPLPVRKVPRKAQRRPASQQEKAGRSGSSLATQSDDPRTLQRR